MYNIPSNQWVWLSGSNTVNVAGVYGIKGVPSVNNYPGGRRVHSMALHPTLNCIYVFGGYTFSGG
jgi:hypothetical protein